MSHNPSQHESFQNGWSNNDSGKQQQRLPTFSDTFPQVPPGLPSPTQPRMYNEFTGLYDFAPPPTPGSMGHFHQQSRFNVNAAQIPQPYSTVENTFLPAPYRAPLSNLASSSTPALLSRPRGHPTNFPLPPDDPNDFPPANDLVPNAGRSDGRTTVKRKRQAGTAASAPVKKSKGRTAGAPNYTDEEVHGLLDLIEQSLPIGAAGWNSVGDAYLDWAKENGYAERGSSSLQTKFKQILKQTKPTGDPDCPDWIDRAHEINNLINEKTGCRELNDDDIDDRVVVVSSDENDENLAAQRAPVRRKKVSVKAEPHDGPVARRPASNRLPAPRARRHTGQDLLNNITSALGPEAQAARSEEHSARAIQTTQMFSLHAQIRDLQRINESLRQDVTAAQREVHAAERRADRAELTLELRTSNFNTPIRPSFAHSTPRAPSRDSSRRSRSQSRQSHHSRSQVVGVAKSIPFHLIWMMSADMSGEFDDYGTRRILLEDRLSPSPQVHPPSISTVQPSTSFKSPAPDTAFHSAASGLNGILRSPGPAPSLSASNDVTVTSSGFSVVISPRRPGPSTSGSKAD
ncbi:hypothetical protein C8J56DRAFT_904441 [Mycena floridula]|nr:hypothetical protein C8J56DRAFT_904441 [Mycena floridula]